MSNGSSLLDKILRARRDTSPYLFHFTKRYFTDDPVWGTEETSAGQVLVSIVSEKKLHGSVPFGDPAREDAVVCFSEAPLFEIASIMSLPEWRRSRYEPYGIAVRKDWLFEKGARPVIYQPYAERNWLPEHLRFRHVSFDPNDPLCPVDFTWEREWRMAAKVLHLDPPENALAIVPTAKEAYLFGRRHPTWNFTSLELLLQDF